MNKRTLAMILLVIPILTIGYAIYRSTSETITTIANGKQVVYGEPQHGLTLGLCVFAGFCILGSVLLLLDEWRRPSAGDAQHQVTTKTSKIATNYPQ
jgi:hypothetical protein